MEKKSFLHSVKYGITMVYQWYITGTQCMGLPMLDDNVKSLEDDSSVTNNNTMICQGFVLSQSLIGISL